MSSVNLDRVRRLIELSRYRDALEMAGEVLANDPENVDALSLAAIAALEDNQLDKADEFASMAQGLSPDSGYQSYILGKVRLGQGRLNEARDLAKTALSRNPEGVEYLLFIAEVHLHKGEWKTGQQWLHKARNLEPANRRALEMEAACLLNLGQNRQARKILAQALNSDPQSFWGHYLAGVGFSESGDYGKARKHYRESLRSNPNFSPAKVELRKVAIARKIPLVMTYDQARKSFAYLPFLLAALAVFGGIVFVLSKGLLRFSGLGETAGLPLRLTFSLAAAWLMIQWFRKVPDTLLSLVLIGQEEEKMFLAMRHKWRNRKVAALLGFALFFGAIFLMFPLPIVGGFAGLLAFMALPTVTIGDRRGWRRWLLRVLAAGALMMGLAAMWPLLSQRAAHLWIEGMVMFWALVEWVEK